MGKFILIICILILTQTSSYKNNNEYDKNVDVQVYEISETNEIAAILKAEENDILTKQENAIVKQEIVALDETCSVIEIVVEKCNQESSENRGKVNIINEGSHTKSSQEYLLSIDNPDYTYTTYPMTLSDYDREQLAHMVYGEFGTGGFIGCALIAQCVRDAMVKFGYTSIDEVIDKMQYSGWNYDKPSDFVYDAIDYIFEQGKAAVQHEILVMYATQHVYSGWHEAQEFVIEYEYVRFFDY